jgi:hypothetical protein
MLSLACTFVFVMLAEPSRRIVFQFIWNNDCQYALAFHSEYALVFTASKTLATLAGCLLPFFGLRKLLL